MIDDLEAMWRSFANNLLNIKMERLLDPAKWHETICLELCLCTATRSGAVLATPTSLIP
jgi:hypothetical protein